eukprot:gene10750-12519_t
MACTDDHECGPAPFAACRQKFDIFEGLGIDGQNLVLLGRYNSSGGPFGYTYIATLPVTGGPLTPQYPILSDIPSGPGFVTTRELFDYVDGVPYLAANQRVAITVGPYSNSTKTFSPVWFQRSYTLGALMDMATKKTYYCDIGIHRLDSIPTKYQDLGEDVVHLYQSQRCTFLGVNGNDLYVVFVNYGLPQDTKTTIYRGKTDCANCPASDLVEILTVPCEVTDFAMTSTHMYLSSNPKITKSSGIGELPLSGDNRLYRQIVNDPVVSFVFDSTNTNLYFTTTDGLVKTAPVSNNLNTPATLLYDSRVPAGVCSCANGFSGSTCQECNGFIRWVDGQPSCVAEASSGQPAGPCVYDYECGQIPFAVCNMGTCDCRPGFQGKKCECPGHISWDNGFPTCGASKSKKSIKKSSKSHKK